jgi:hypothetical protein
MLTIAQAVKRLRRHGQMPPDGTVNVMDLQKRFQPTPAGSVKSLLTKMFGSVGGWSRPDANTVVLNNQIVTGGIDALGGWVEVTLQRDGTVRFRGHIHDSGFESYDFHIRAMIHVLDNIALAMQRSGHVSGTASSASRDADWDETVIHPLVASRFDQIQNCWIEVAENHTGGLSGTIEDIASFALRWFGGALLIGSTAGLVIFAGAELGSLLATGSLVPGARIAEGLLWLTGPYGTLYALAAEGVASLGSRSRELSQAEYDFAQPVFAGMLPARNRLILTDTIGGDNRAFTWPRFDGKITINMGAESYDDPRNYHIANGSKKYGETFIHELVHAWQIHYASMDVALLADAFASKVCEASGISPYNYGAAGAPFSDFNLEQQAKIVANWFIKYYKKDSNSDNQGLNTPEATNDPYFRYIEGNIRVGAA